MYVHKFVEIISDMLYYCHNPLSFYLINHFLKNENVIYLERMYAVHTVFLVMIIKLLQILT